MKTETLFRKVLVSERLPIKGDRYFTNDGISVYSPHTNQFLLTNQAIEYWLEPVELPSEEELKVTAINYDEFESNGSISDAYEEGANYIIGFINNKK